MCRGGRKADDPLGTMPHGEFIAMEGGTNNGSNRWGDYSAMSVDPVDDSTFWYTSEYMNNGWKTRVISMAFENCNLAAPGNFNVAAAGLKDINVTWAAVDGATSYNLYRADGACGGALTLLASGLTGTSYNDHDVTAGSEYSYTVSAVQGVGCESPQTACAAATAPACTDLNANLPDWNNYLTVLDLVNCPTAP